MFISGAMSSPVDCRHAVCDLVGNPGWPRHSRRRIGSYWSYWYYAVNFSHVLTDTRLMCNDSVVLYLWYFYWQNSWYEAIISEGEYILFFDVISCGACYHKVISCGSRIFEASNVTLLETMSNSGSSFVASQLSVNKTNPLVLEGLFATAIRMFRLLTP